MVTGVMGDGEPDLDGEELVRGGQGRETVNDVIFLMVKENTDKMPHLKFSLYDALLLTVLMAFKVACFCWKDCVHRLSFPKME